MAGPWENVAKRGKIRLSVGNRELPGTADELRRRFVIALSSRDAPGRLHGQKNPSSRHFSSSAARLAASEAYLEHQPRRRIFIFSYFSSSIFCCLFLFSCFLVSKTVVSFSFPYSFFFNHHYSPSPLSSLIPFPLLLRPLFHQHHYHKRSSLIFLSTIDMFNANIISIFISIVVLILNFTSHRH